MILNRFSLIFVMAFAAFNVAIVSVYFSIFLKEGFLRFPPATLRNVRQGIILSEMMRSICAGEKFPTPFKNPRRRFLKNDSDALFVLYIPLRLILVKSTQESLQSSSSSEFSNQPKNSFSLFALQKIAISPIFFASS